MALTQDASATKARIAASYNPAGRNIRNVWTITTQPFSLELCSACKRIYDQKHYRRLAKDSDGRRLCSCGANDWLSHFATFPPDLVRPCILMATSANGNCPECGSPWARVVNTVKMLKSKQSGKPWLDSTEGVVIGRETTPHSGLGLTHNNISQTLGWRPTCTCNAGEPVPAVVLDPFVGSGTTAIVAKELGRRSIGIDLAEDYLRLAQYRIERTADPLPMELPPVTMGPKPELGPAKAKLSAVLPGQKELL